ncbi:MAG: fimbrial assembly protein FimA [Phototrophicales bacterium]|nr:MAG: fimbrial assembly protein FimA [Phototrophicales bacterium]
MRQVNINTFSIVGYDPVEQAWGVAVASKFLAAAAVVSWARAGAGAVATQAFAKMSFGPDGLDLMESGMSAQQALENLLADDPKAAHRQVGLIDANGNATAHTGAECFAWAGHKIGEYYTCQGNILTGEETLDAMANAFETTKGPLADRLLAALLAGDDVGGDKRGKQSAGILVVKADASYGGDTDRLMDLRVDDDPEPVKRLAALVKMHYLFFGTPKPEDLLDIDRHIATELQQILMRTGHYQGPISGEWDTASKEAFWAFCGVENLEERWSLDQEPDKIDRVTLDYIRERFSA